jgi:hypothetical protein
VKGFLKKTDEDFFFFFLMSTSYCNEPPVIVTNCYFSHQLTPMNSVVVISLNSLQVSKDSNFLTIFFFFGINFDDKLMIT